MRMIGIVINVSFRETGVSTYIKTILESIDEKEKYVLFVNDESWNDYLKGKGFRTFINKELKLSFLYKILVLLNLRRLGVLIFRKIHPFSYLLRRFEIGQVIFPTPCYLTFFIDGFSCVSVHDLMHLTERKFKESSSFIKYKYRNNIYTNIGVNFDKIIFESNVGRNMFNNYYKIGEYTKTYLLPYCCPSYLIRILENKTYKSFDIDKYGAYLFYPASFWSHKNHHRLIHAFKNLVSGGFDINMVFSGGYNKEYNKLKKLVSSLNLDNRIIFTGYVSDEEIVALYVGSKALVMPTFFGPTNIPPIESIYCETPVLISGIYGMKEQLEDAALYFDPTSIKDIEMCLLSFFDTNRAVLIEKGQNLKPKFSLELFKSKLITVIDEV